MSIFSKFKSIFEFKYITPTIGLLVLLFKINLLDIEANSLSFNKFSSFIPKNLKSIIKSALTPDPFSKSALLKLFE